ncbi:MAG: efflux RND transporter periplasmic adaptor subunit [Bacteroidales bacterium]|nr:efflux RND transporter periplasmic adaptor subunit [Bacteroidales bacterium]
MNSFSIIIRSLIILTIMLPVLFACNESKEKAGGTSSAPLLVEAMIVKPQYFESKFVINANLLPYEETELKAPVSGNVLSIFFKEGDKVSKGQPLIKIDDRIWKARLKGLKSQLSIARSDSTRNAALIDVQGVSQEAVDKTNAQIQELHAQIEELQVNISLANVTAPFTGRLGMRDFSVGAYLSQGMTITRIVQADKLKVDFEMPGRYIQNIKLGEQIQMIYHDDTLTAKVYAIDPRIDPNSRTIRIRCELPNPGEKYVPGIFASVIIPTNITQNALVVPTSAVIPALNTQTLYVYHAGKAFRKEVELGDRTNVEVQIMSGLNPGDTILLTGLMMVKDNMPVQIKEIVKGNQP